MKKSLVIGLAVVLGIGLIGYAVADPRPGGGWGMMGGAHMGSGWMMRGSMRQGRSGGPGWMHRGPGVGLGFNPCGQLPGKPAGEKLTKEKAETLVKQQLLRMA